MKRTLGSRLHFFLALLALLLFLTAGCAFSEETASPGEDEKSPSFTGPSGEDGGSEYFRAFWVATVYRLDYPSSEGLSPALLAAEADEILDFAADCGYRAVILQIRPDAAAFYPSDIFPWSRFLTGKEGQAPEEGFDPLAYFLEGAHDRGLELHGWINPYRITRGTPLPGEQAMDALSEKHPARQHPEWVTSGTDGHLYFDPGLPEVRAMLVDSIDELLCRYDLDGIHFDDYFYPDGGLDDRKTYDAFGREGQSLADFRRESVTALIRTVGERVRQKDGCRFGVSPFGIWANAGSLPEGSDTSGSQSYFDHYADSRSWVKEGLVDYIVPQLYWEKGHPDADYETLVDWWCDAVRGTGVDLYIGQAAHLAMNEDPGSVWQGTDEISRQLALNFSRPEVAGSVFFRYRYLADEPELAAASGADYSSETSAPEQDKGRE